MATPGKETGKARAAKEQYLMLGPERSLSKLVESMGKSPGYIQVLKVWSRHFKWQEAAREYDAEQAAKRRREIEAERDRINKEHLLLGRTHAEIAAAIIKDLAAKGKYNPQAANQLLKIATDLQRLAIGAATAQVELSGKDNEPIDIIVETFWGRGTDPRKRNEQAEEIEEEAEQDYEDDDFSAEIPEDDWEVEEEQ